MKWSLLVAVLVIAAPALALRQSDDPRQSAAAPEVVVRQFYHWYLHSLNQHVEPLEKQKTVLRKYLTQRFFQELERLLKRGELDYDHFLEAQDWDEAWEKNITVSRARIQGGTAVTSVALTGPQMSKKLQVTLRQEGGLWKIDKVGDR